MREQTAPHSLRRAAQERPAQDLAEQFPAPLAALAALLTSASDGIIGKTLEHVVTSWNPAAERIYGYPAEEMLGRPISRLVPPERLEELRRLHEHLARKQPIANWQTVRVRKDGRRIEVALTVLPVLDPAGRPLGTVTRVHDITPEKLLQEQLRRAQQLELAGQLAGGLAHDFNNLVGVIRANTDLLRLDSGPFTPEAAECLREIQLATDRAATLARRLLALSRPHLPELRALDLNAVLAEASRLLRRVIPGNIQLHCRLAPALPPVQGDAASLEQVLFNLALNARDAMPAGGQLRLQTERVRIPPAYVQAHPAARPGEFVCVSLADTGTGIAPELLPRIFEPFFTTKAPGKGSGLGLPTVRSIVHQHQGWLEVSSQVGLGTTFNLYLPAGDGRQ